jgi:hypothetical protein
MSKARVKWGPQCAHQTGQPWITTWTPDKVAAAPDPVVGLASYAQQVLGIPFPRVSDITAARKHINELFNRYPTADYHTLCRVVRYAKSQRRRFTMLTTVVCLWRDAMGAGKLNELDPSNDFALLEQINRILEIETDERWRTRLLCCLDNDSRRLAISDWRTLRGPIAAA